VSTFLNTVITTTYHSCTYAVKPKTDHHCETDDCSVPFRPEAVTWDRLLFWRKYKDYLSTNTQALLRIEKVYAQNSKRDVTTGGRATFRNSKESSSGRAKNCVSFCAADRRKLSFTGHSHFEQVQLLLQITKF
jgi:hypothetical protein